ncbi:MAG: DctP family TRAP transporter solute-binding subunit [Clostridiales bacterium]
MHKKLAALLLIVFMMVALAGCGGGGSNVAGGQANDSTAAQTYNWRLPHEEVVGSCQDLYANKFKEIVESKSEGRIIVDVYPVGQLGDSTNQVELLQMGGVEFAINNPGATATIIPEANVFSLHFLMPSDMAGVRKVVTEGEGIKKLNALYESQGMYVLDWFPEGFNVWTANKPIVTPEDMKGFKIRTMAAPVIAKSYEAYGANPVPVPYMELYSALQLKMVDGQVNPLFAIDEMKFAEVQKYLMLSNQDSFVGTFAANRDYWNTLPEDIQKIVKDAVAECNQYLFEKQQELNEKALENIKATTSIEVIELTDSQRDVFRSLVEPARRTYVDMTGESGKEIMELIVADVDKL